MPADARAVKLGASTGTLVAADWTSVDGFGLDLDLIEAVLDGRCTYAEPDPLGQVTVTDAAEAARELTIAEMDDVLPPAVRKLTRAARRHN